MRRTATVVLTAAVLGLASAPAWAEPTGAGGWEPAPSSPVTIPAGARCSFAVKLEPIVDGVQRRVLETYPDGSVKREEFKGTLIERVTNLDSGASEDVNASGHAYVDHHVNGDVTWSWDGPVIMGFAPGHSNHAPGLFRLTGEFVVDFVSGDRIVRRADGSERNLCTELS